MSEEKAPKMLFGKPVKEKTTINEVKVQEPETVSPTITLSIEELNAMIDAKVAAATKPQAQASQKITTPAEERTIKNLMTDDIPELRDFKPRERIYVLCDGNKPEAREVKTRNKPGSPLIYFNKETNSTHSLFFSMSQASFYKEKHVGDSKVDHIFFKEGMLKTREDDFKLQSFLHIHPDNKANGGTVFEEYNAGVEAINGLEDIDIKFEAEKLAREISFIKQDSIARLLCKGYKETWTPAEMKLSLFLEAGKQPKNFMKLANDPSVEIKGLAKTAVMRGFIEYRNYKFVNDLGEVIVDVPRNSDEFEVLANHFLSGQGRTYFEYLKNAIE